MAGKSARFLALLLALCATTALSADARLTPHQDVSARGLASTNKLIHRQDTSKGSTGGGGGAAAKNATSDDAAPSGEAIKAATDKYEGTTYKPSAHDMPKTTQEGQVGTNNCGTESKPDSLCQNGYFNSITDWCAFIPQKTALVSDVEEETVAACTVRGRGTRGLSPAGLKGATFVVTPAYYQITAVGDFTAWNVAPKDDGGELDPHGATGLGNPIGGLMFHCSKDKGCEQAHEWMEFLAYNEYCKRVCFDGPDAMKNCQHVYDTQGCSFNIPGTYEEGTFQQCESDVAPDVSMYNGVKYEPGTEPVPEPHAAPPLRNCKSVKLEDIFGTITDGDPFGPTGALKIKPLSKAEIDASGAAAPANNSADSTASGTDAGSKKNTTAGGALSGGAGSSTGANLTANSPSAAAGNLSAAAMNSTNAVNGSAQTPTSNEGVISVEASRRIGWALIAIVVGLFGGCVLL